jgi:shikimate dehydrogenase
MIIDQHTELYGVVGYPLGHSLSPTMHNSAFQVSRLNAAYLAFETRDIGDCLKGMKALGIKGLSVTLPFKSRVIPLLDDVDDHAKRIGAVNTIVNDNGRLKGYNTDAIGVLKSLEEEGIDLSRRKCLLIGAGGAARSIGFTLKEKGIEVTVANRSIGSGEKLARFLGSPFVPLKDIEKIKADLIVQATPVGMYPHTDQCLIPGHLLKKGIVVMDIIYNPIETRALKLARDCGCKTISGLSMFIHQGGEQFRLWTGFEPPLKEMTRSVKEELRG